MSVAAEFMSAIINAFQANKRLADRAVEQVPDEKLHVALNDDTNSIAVIMKHVAGNLLSESRLSNADDSVMVRGLLELACGSGAEPSATGTPVPVP